MESYNISMHEGRINIQGINDAVHLKKLPEKLGRTLSDYSLHQNDLLFAKHNLDAINKEEILYDDYLRQALWRSAIVHYVKCFTPSKARGQLSFDRVYRNAPDEARIAYDYIKELRDKTIAHDQNSYAQSIPCAALNAGNKSYKVEKILFINFQADSLNNENYSNLYLLISQALDFVNSELDNMFIRATEMVEMLKFDEIMKFEDVNYTSPTLDDVSKKRRY